jgi:hypothetical protein
LSPVLRLGGLEGLCLSQSHGLLLLRGAQAALLGALHGVPAAHKRYMSYTISDSCATQISLLHFTISAQHANSHVHRDTHVANMLYARHAVVTRQGGAYGGQPANTFKVEQNTTYTDPQMHLGLETQSPGQKHPCHYPCNQHIGSVSAQEPGFRA